MNAVKPTPFTTPDGVERELRFTLGARKRIVELLGMHMNEALNKYDSGAFPEILFALLHDESGNPPAGITVPYLAEHLLPEQTTEILSAIYAAGTNGRVEKKILEPVIAKLMREILTGSKSGASAPNPSDLQMNSSGGDTSNVKSMPESNDTPNSNASGITASES